MVTLLARSMQVRALSHVRLEKSRVGGLAPSWASLTDYGPLNPNPILDLPKPTL